MKTLADIIEQERVRILRILKLVEDLKMAGPTSIHLLQAYNMLGTAVFSAKEIERRERKKQGG